MIRFVYAGFVDGVGVHEVRITPDAAPAALERGWTVLDEALIGVPVCVSKPDATGHSGPEDDDDDGA